MGPGSHLKHLIQRRLGVNSGGCGGCEKLLREMDDNGHAWCRQNLTKIVPRIRQNADRNPDWKVRAAARLPGIKWPIRWMVLEAIRRAERDQRQQQVASTHVTP